MDITILPTHFITKHLLDADKHATDYEILNITQISTGWRADFACHLTNQTYNLFITKGEENGES